MSFAAPWMLWWGLLAVPIIILYVLKVRVRRLPVSTLMFWEQVYDEKAPRSLWERLRHLSSLLMQLLLLLLLVLALADPVFDWETRNARRVVLIIDNSASMQAVDVAPTRLDAAKLQASALLRGLRPRDQMAVLSAGTQPEVVVGMTGHARTLANAVDAIPATDGPTKVGDAIELARRLVSDHENSQIVVLSDAAFDQADSLLKADDITWFPIGGNTGNIGITQFQVRRSLIDPIGYEILAGVTNSGNEPVEVRLDLELAGAVIDAIPLKLSPKQMWQQTFQKTSATGGELVATLAFADKIPKTVNKKLIDALTADNTARSILPAQKPRPVYLVTKGNLFLESAFRASPLVELAVVPQLPADRVADSLVVFHGEVPAELPTGAVLVIDPRGSTNLWDLGGTIDNPIVAKQSAESPLLAHVKLQELYLPQARKLVPKPPLKAEALAETADKDPLVLTMRSPGQKVLILTANLEQGDLPLRTAFPIVLANALAWYSEGAGELRESLPVGSMADLPVDERKQYQLVSPDGSATPLPKGQSRVSIGPFEQAGLWRVVPIDADRQAKESASEKPAEPAVVWPEGTQTIACNIASPGESDLSPRSLRSESPDLAAAGWAGRPMWFYLLVGVTLLVPAEWLLYQRRFIQ